MQLTVLPLLAERMENKFDIFEALENTLEKNETKLQEGDVIVISTKYISNSQGRIIDLEKIKASKYGMKIADEYQLKPGIAEIIIRESDKIFGGIGGFVITSADNIMAPNAGIDKSNAKKGKAILYPIDPYLIAEQIRRKVFLKLLIHVGVILVDSRLMPARIGTSGVAVSCAGVEPVLDMRSKKRSRWESIESYISSSCRQSCNNCKSQNGRRCGIKTICNSKRFRCKTYK